MRFFLTLSLCLYLSTFATAQYGPGGVGNSSSNGLWLRADAINLSNASAISNWPDRSGNGNDAAQTNSANQPLFYNSSTLNNQPVINLDGNDDLLLVPDTDILDGTESITYFAVVQATGIGGNPDAILSKRITYTVNANYSYAWFFWTGNRLFGDIHTNNNRFNSGSTTFSNNTGYLLSFDFDGGRPSSERSRMFNGGDLIAEEFEASTILPNSNQDLHIGQLNGNNSSYYEGDMAEIIHYNYALNDVERIIVQNYLSAKYAIDLAQDDYYDEDNSANGNFDHDVAGIGRLGSLIHNDAQGSGPLRVSSPSHLDDGEFMLWGHDDGTFDFSNTSDIPSGSDNRLERVWRLSEVQSTTGAAADVGSVTLTWDLSNFSSINVTDLQLLVDSDGDGTFADETPITGASDLGGGRYQFTTVLALTNNTRFTLGSTDNTITLLNTELSLFQVRSQAPRQALLRWETAQEDGLHAFEVQRSANGDQWQALRRVEANGQSNSTQYYQFTDAYPLENWSYYRLKLLNLDGSFSYSDAKSFYLTEDEIPLELYPNPSSAILNVKTVDIDWAQWQVFDVTGRSFKNQLRVLQQNEQELQLDISALPAGTYFLKTGYAVRAFQKH